MESNIKVVGLTAENKPCWVPVSLEQLVFNCYCVISVDGSSSTTGVTIADQSSGAIMASCAFSRSKGESAVEYKVALKRTLRTIMLQNVGMKHSFYEEPFIGHAQSTKVLFMLRTCIEELIAENAPVLDRVKSVEVNNLKWKRMFLEPDKCPSGSEAQKKAVREKMIAYIPIMAEVTQDEIDSASMCVVCVNKLRTGLESELETKKKPRAFGYEIRFIGADEDDDVAESLAEWLEDFKAPRVTYAEGARFVEVDGRGKFENKIYSHMGTDDILLILKFDSSKNGDVILEHKIGHLAKEYRYIYAVIWRKNRKKQ